MGRQRGAGPEGASDEALLAGLAVGDERAGAAFVRRYQGRVFGLALSMVGDRGAAEDIAQEALVRVWRHAAVFDPRRAGVATWVLAITRHLAIDAMRVRRGAPADPDDQVWHELVSTERQPDAAAITAASLGRLRAALAELPIEQRRVVLLAGLYGRTAAEIAESEAIPLGTAKSRIRMGMAKLRVTVTAEEEP